MDVVGIGALNYDRLFKVSKIACSDEEEFIKSFSEECGGSAANTIVGLARLGLKTGFIGNVGNDYEGKKILECFIKEGVDVSKIKTKKGKSGVVFGFVDESGERALYVYPGVNDYLSIDDEEIEYINKAKIVHMSSFVGENSYKEQKKLVNKIKAKISFAPGMLYAKKGIEEIKAIIEKSFVVFLNRKEVEVLTGLDYIKGSKLLLETGAKIVVVTLGREGCIINGDIRVKGFETKVVDTTGAGDAFATGFLYGLIKGYSLKKCGLIGNKIASLCIAKVGARKGLPREEDIKDFIKKI